MKNKNRYKRRIDNMISAIWMTDEPIYEMLNNKRKMMHLPMVRFRLFRKLEIERFEKYHYKESTMSEKFDIENYREVLENLNNTVCFIEGFEEIVLSTLSYYGVDYISLSEEEKGSIEKIIVECDCGVIKLSESPCENCGG
ncbi:MAG: hypothetical protein JEZ08_15385 [Clostridiales bacterium]|nr:hypothetical protein [Clostridiales bacterium]